MEGTNTVESRSDFARFLATAAYGILVLCCVCFVMGRTMSPEGSTLLMKSFQDVWLFVVITALGVGFRYFFGAYSTGCKTIGAIGVFFLFTLGHDPMTRYLTLSALLFAIGLYGMVRSRNAVRVLMSIELMLNAVNINLITFARYIDPAGVKGHIFAIFILTVAAAEAAVGLAIVLSIYRNLATVDMDRFNLLRW